MSHQPLVKLHNIVCTKEHLEVMASYIEVTHNAICGQWGDLLTLVAEKHQKELTWEKRQFLEVFLNRQILDIKDGDYLPSGHFDELGYQTYRDILEWFFDLQNPGISEEDRDKSFNVYAYKSKLSKKPKLIIT